MIDHLLNIAIMALAAIGAWTAMGEGMVLEPVRKWIEKHATPFLSKPLATCPRCMVTIYGTAALLVLGVAIDIYTWPVYLVCAVGLQEMLHR